MPTNLPPEYFEAEKQYRAAQSPEEKIATLEELIGTIPKHKGTDKLRADFRKRLSKLKSAAQTRKGTSKQESPYHIDKEEAGQVVIVGATNAGKSALVTALTNASPEVSEAPYTTWQPTPGMMPYENIQIQLIDTPPLDRNYVEPEMLNLIRRCDLLLVAVDLQADPVRQLQEAIAILEENRIVPLDLADRYQEDRRLCFKPLLVLVNKYDDEDSAEVFDIFCELLEDDWPLIPVSAVSGRNLEHMKRLVYEQLEVMRVYSKPPGKDPDRSAPFVLDKGSTVEEFAAKVHQDFVANLKSARVWGSGAYDGQMVGRDHVLSDGDIVELRI